MLFLFVYSFMVVGKEFSILLKYEFLHRYFSSFVQISEHLLFRTPLKNVEYVKSVKPVLIRWNYLFS